MAKAHLRAVKPAWAQPPRFPWRIRWQIVRSQHRQAYGRRSLRLWWADLVYVVKG